MRFLVLCLVLSIIFTVSWASPVKTQISDDLTSSDGSESTELKDTGRTTSSSEEDQQQVVAQQKTEIHDNNEEDNSADTSEESKKKENEINSLEEEEEDVNGIFNNKKIASRSKRAMDFASHVHNQLVVKNEDSGKYDKYFKLKRLRRTLFSSEYNGFSKNTMRLRRSADETSEENSSEEEKKSEGPAANKQAAVAAIEGEIGTKKANIAESEPNHNEEAKGVRRRRDLEVSKEEEEDQSVKDHSDNEVFIFSNENQTDSVEDMKNNEHPAIDEKNLEKTEISLENKESAEDYAQGCGGSNNSEGDDSNEHFVENEQKLINI